MITQPVDFEEYSTTGMIQIDYFPHLIKAPMKEPPIPDLGKFLTQFVYL
jgi:hypothetical protein